MNSNWMSILFCYVAPGILLAIGLWHLVNPVGVWKLGRLHAASTGHATDETPPQGALGLVQVRGVILLVVAIAFSVFSHTFFSKWNEKLETPPAIPMRR